MTLQTGIRWARAFMLACLLASFAVPSLAFPRFAAPAPDKKEKPKPPDADVKIDSGTFGILIKGQRVASETFSIEQKSGVSIIKSEVKEIGPADPASQKSFLEITSTGELLRYDWSQSTGGSLMVFPENEFLKETITASAGTKAAEQAFLLPPVTSILDNNFFVHRELLVWKYLATAPCKDENGQRQCQSVDFGALVPQDRTLHARAPGAGGERKNRSPRRPTRTTAPQSHGRWFRLVPLGGPPGSIQTHSGSDSCR